MTSTERRDDEPFLRYPMNRVVGIIDSDEQAMDAVQALTAAGFPEEDINVLCGPEGARRLDATGRNHGPLARLIRLAQNLSDMGNESLRRHDEALNAGHFVVAIVAPAAEQREQARRILKAHGGHFINFYDRLVVETLDP